VKDAEVELRALIKRINEKKLSEKKMHLILSIQCSTSWVSNKIAQINQFID
jgi:hypothetical protein